MALKTKMNDYVDLIKLKADNYLYNKDFNVKLNDDIWEDSLLLVKSGRYLTEDLINKLLNFGIRKVKVDFVEKEKAIIEEEPISEDFIKTQKVLIIENNLLNSSVLVRNLVDMGFNKGNIYITANYNSINKFFKVKKINFIFIGMTMYEKCMKVLNKYSLLRNTHTFVIMDKNDSARKIKNGYVSDVKFLKKPISLKFFNVLINKALMDNLDCFFSEEAYVC